MSHHQETQTAGHRNRAVIDVVLPVVHDDVRSFVVCPGQRAAENERQGDQPGAGALQ